MNEPLIGSDFDSFLEEEGILQETERIAVKRVLALQLQAWMAEPKKLATFFILFILFILVSCKFFQKISRSAMLKNSQDTRMKRMKRIKKKEC